MQQKVSPAMIVVAIIVLVLIVVAIWWFTMGKQAGGKAGPAVDAGTMQPKTPEEAAKAGYKQGPGGTQPQPRPPFGSK